MENFIYRWNAWRIRRTRAKLDRLLQLKARYWQVQVVGGLGSVPLGIVTEAEAIEAATRLRYPIINVDRPGAFVACRPSVDDDAGGAAAVTGGGHD